MLAMEVEAESLRDPLPLVIARAYACSNKAKRASTSKTHRTPPSKRLAIPTRTPAPDPSRRRNVQSDYRTRFPQSRHFPLNRTLHGINAYRRRWAHIPDRKEVERSPYRKTTRGILGPASPSPRQLSRSESSHSCLLETKKQEEAAASRLLDKERDNSSERPMAREKNLLYIFMR